MNSITNIDEFWNLYGFRDNPYRYTPLQPTEFDEGLYASRGDAEAKFSAAVTDRSGGIVTIGGDVGTGKTSFANVLQHRFLKGTAGFGLRPMPCFIPTSFERGGTAQAFAKKVVQNTLKSIGMYCDANKRSLPSRTARYHDWLFGGATTALTVGGTGKTVNHVTASTVEECVDILKAVANECSKAFRLDGLFVCLDNAETPEPKDLTDLLKDLRDSLLAVPGIWWVIIGPTDIQSKISELNVAVAQRIAGSGIRLAPLTAGEFHSLIERRVRSYGTKATARAPLSAKVHEMLHNAAGNELRFALKRGHDILLNLNSKMYAYVQSRYSAAGKSPTRAAILLDVKALLNERMAGGDTFLDSHVEVAMSEICREELLPANLPRALRAELQRFASQPFTSQQLAASSIIGDVSSLDYLSRLERYRVVARMEQSDEERWVLIRDAALLATIGKLGE